ncbi:MAG: helix-turn-helix domain-containing protein [Terriglobia bacterium]
MTGRLLKAKEAAEIMNVSVAKIRSDIMHRRICFVKLNGKSVRIPASEVERIITAGTVPAKGVSNA